ncbi:tRNA (adenine(22)-N(1))-methyltransferase [Lacticaseibacillus brantae]|uniref:SAM-dependent methyltransferase n=1 Tax=Lacticaseibacillus brantae DSM 23927 TaxID=1423727 RepID=A0A0R2B413_9LACO|nr:class I SAM-dependent methyltransferase [Lacticaseibacillus brantae]KRM72692.1 SAM-dependent methyltransferase [Lacticaseibacillus brantae DSM 23927]
MQNFHLSKRLTAISQFVTEGDRVADIGTDHAYVPIHLVENGTIDFAIASDVGEGPVKIAKANIEAAGLSDKIDVRLADGLTGIKPEDAVSAVIIAGMGGQLINDILDAGLDYLDGTETLILGPNRDVFEVRQWLNQHEFGIVDEAILEEDGHVYEIVVAGRTKPEVPYTDADLQFGPILRKQKSPLFIEQLKIRGEKTEAILAGLSDANLVPFTKIREQENLLKLIEAELA